MGIIRPQRSWKSTNSYVYSFQSYAMTQVQRRADGEKYRAGIESKEVPEIYRNKKRRVEKPNKLPVAKIITISYWSRIVKWFKCLRKK